MQNRKEVNAVQARCLPKEYVSETDLRKLFSDAEGAFDFQGFVKAHLAILSFYELKTRGKRPFFQHEQVDCILLDLWSICFSEDVEEHKRANILELRERLVPIICAFVENN
jgi:hypothetical protein